MTTVYLPANFAPQSSVSARLVLTQIFEQAGTLAAFVEADVYPSAGILRLEGLRPNRHYLLRGTAQRFSRTDERGTARLELVLTGPTLLLISPVI